MVDFVSVAPTLLHVAPLLEDCCHFQVRVTPAISDVPDAVRVNVSPRFTVTFEGEVTGLLEVFNQLTTMTPDPPAPPAYPVSPALFTPPAPPPLPVFATPAVPTVPTRGLPPPPTMVAPHPPPLPCGAE